MTKKVEAKLSRAQIAVSEDLCSVILGCSAEYAGRAEAINEIRAELEFRKIKEPLKLEILSQALEQAKSDGKDISNLVIATATLPVPSQPARLEWSKEYFAAGYYVDPATHAVDYHRRAATPAVSQDELIVVVHQPIPGQNGVDVYGAVIKAAPPVPVEIKAGANVIWDEAVRGFRAANSGRVKLNGKALEVHNLIQIPDNVGAATGNIDHGGAIVIQGGIESEFEVKAKGDIDVRDAIGAANIECGGNLTVAKGISSATGKKIIVKGNLHAKYLEHATVLSEGDVIVETEILDSSVRTTGQVVCSGRVSGGDIIAAAGIHVSEVGSHNDTRTMLIAGVDYRLVNARRGAAEKSKKLKEVITKLEVEQKRFKMLGQAINHKQRERLTELEFLIFEATETYEQLNEQRKEQALQMLTHKGATITIDKLLNPGTVLRVLDSHMEVRDALAGPMMARLDAITKQITLTSIDPATKE